MLRPCPESPARSRAPVPRASALLGIIVALGVVGPFGACSSGEPTAATGTGPAGAAAPATAVIVAAVSAPSGLGSTATTLTSASPPQVDPARQVLAGAAHFTRLCALCHGTEAQGYAADNAPSLISSTFLATATDEFLRLGIERGRPGTAMGGFGRSVGGPLGLSDVDAIIAFLRAKNPTPLQALPKFVAGGNVENGRQIYERECVTCHGTLTQRGNAVHLANPVLLVSASDAFLRHAVVFGRPGTPMEAFGGRLDGRATNDVITYVRSLAATAPSIAAMQPPLPASMTPSSGPAAVPTWTPIPLNPKGGTPKFTLRAERFVPMAEVKKALDDKKRIIIVDARPPSDWNSLHIPGSVPLPYYNLELIDRIPNDGTWVIAYCGCPHHASGEVVDALRRKGHKNAAVLDEGMFAWQKAGFPVMQAPGMPGIAAPPVYMNDKPQPLQAPPASRQPPTASPR